MNFQQNHSPNYEAKQTAIMEAMSGLVHQYGFSKITMDDIAKASGLSRPALYQFFKNKQDIFRAICQRMCEINLNKMSEVLSSDLPVEERLVQAIVSGKLEMLAEMEATHHGAELIDLSNDLSSDLVAEFTSGMKAQIQNLFELALPKNSPYSSETMALNLMFWLEGMKVQVKDISEREAMLRQFVALQFAAINKS